LLFNRRESQDFGSYLEGHLQLLLGTELDDDLFEDSGASDEGGLQADHDECGGVTRHAQQADAVYVRKINCEVTPLHSSKDVRQGTNQLLDLWTTSYWQEWSVFCGD